MQMNFELTVEKYAEKIGKILDEAVDAGILAENPSKLDISDAMLEEYTDAVIKAGGRLVMQNPKAVFLPERGGSVHGIDVLVAAGEIARRDNLQFRAHPIIVDARGISRSLHVREELKNYLIQAKESVNNSRHTDEERRKSCMPPRLDDFTIIDSAYTGMSYSRILGTFREVFPEAKINGIVLKDKYFKSDLGHFEWSHKETRGDFYFVETVLLFEDKNVVHHRLNVEGYHELSLKTPDFLRAKDRIYKCMERKVNSAAIQII